MWIYDPKEGYFKRNAETYIESFCANNIGFNAKCICNELSKIFDILDNKEFRRKIDDK